MHQIGPLARSVPYMTALGNHERDWPESGANVGQYDSGGECGVPMNARFTMPANGNALWWYSFDFSAVKTIMLSSEHDLHPGSAQYKWLAAQSK